MVKFLFYLFIKFYTTQNIVKLLFYKLDNENQQKLNKKYLKTSSKHYNLKLFKVFRIYSV